MTTGLIRFNPEADLFRGRMDRLFNQMLNAPWNPVLSEDVTNRGFMPAVDIRERPANLMLTAGFQLHFKQGTTLMFSKYHVF